MISPKSKKIFSVVFILVVLVTSFISCKDGGDFDVYLQAARQLRIRQNIYAPPFIRGLQYFYSVFFALLLSPFAKAVFITEFIWLLISYALLFRIRKLIIYYFDFSILTEKQKRNWLLLSVVLALQFIMYDISLIQITIFLLWSMLETLRLIRNDQQLLAGALLAVVINIKIMPILLLPYLFYRGYFKTILSCIVCFVTLLYLPAIFIGLDYNQYLLQQWWSIINPGNKEHMIEAGIGTHSIVAWLPVYLTPTEGDMPYKRNLFNLSLPAVSMIVNIARLFLLALSLLFLRSTPFKKEKSKLKVFWEASYFLLLIPLLMPHQQKYNFLLAMPMIVYLVYFFITTFQHPHSASYKVAFVMFVISMLVFSPIYGADIIGKFLFKYTQHYRFLTFAALFIIPVALYCNPNKLDRLQRFVLNKRTKPAS